MSIQLTKTHSLQHSSVETYIHETEEERAFYRFECGKLVEFDLTKMNGQPVRLTKEECEEIDKWNDVSLAAL